LLDPISACELIGAGAVDLKLLQSGGDLAGTSNPKTALQHEFASVCLIPKFA
jgi:hypothetical protein